MMPAPMKSALSRLWRARRRHMMRRLPDTPSHKRRSRKSRLTIWRGSPRHRSKSMSKRKSAILPMLIAGSLALSACGPTRIEAVPARLVCPPFPTPPAELMAPVTIPESLPLR